MSDMMIYHGCPSPNSLSAAREAAPSFAHGAEWNPDKMTPHHVPYILDNGAYKAYRNDEEWDPDPFLSRLEEIGEKMPRDPDFVVLPDVLEDGDASIKRSRKWSDKISSFGYRYYLPVQDGMPVEQTVREAVDMGASGIFIGGTRKFKLEYADQFIMTAHDYGLLAHIGRPGTNLSWVRDLGADSIDTTSIVRRGRWDILRKLEAAPRTTETTLTEIATDGSGFGGREETSDTT